MPMENLYEMGFTEKRFPLATHMCLIYSSEEERRKVIGKFLYSGVVNNENVVYLADNVSKSEISSWLQELGLDVNCEHLDNFSIKEAEEVYCGDGYFAPEKMFQSLISMQKSSTESCHHCLRASGEMTWALKGYPGSELLIEYESKLNHLVKTHPFLAICQYDATKFDGKTIHEVLMVHPYMIVKGQILENPFYVTPEVFLQKKHRPQTKKG